MVIQPKPPLDSERESPAEVGYNQVQGEVVDLAYLGSLTTYHVKLDNGTKIKVTHTNAARHGESPLTWGDRVTAWWCGSDVVVLTQ